MAKKPILLLITMLLLLVTSAASAADSPLAMNSDFLFVYPTTNGLEVLNVINFTNKDSAPYAGTLLTDAKGTQRNGFLIPLPSGYRITKDPIGLANGEYSYVPEGVQVYKAIPPSTSAKPTYEIELNYALAQVSPTTITKKTGFNTKDLVIDIPKKALTLKSDLVKYLTTITDQGNEYLRYIAEDVKIDTVLSISVSDAATPKTSVPTSSGSNTALHPEFHMNLFMSEPLSRTKPHVWAAYFITMIILGIAALILWFKISQKREEEAEAKVKADAEAEAESNDTFVTAEIARLESKREALLMRLKILDDEFNNGTITDADYQNKRANIKQLLIEVKMQLKAML